MEFLDLDNSTKWLRKLKILDKKDDILFQKFQLFNKYHIPIDSGRKTALARVITDLMSKSKESLLLITEYGIWPSSENLDLFYGYRKSIGEMDLLSNKPGQLFKDNELNTLNALLALVFYFCWGALIVRNDLKYLIKISHDEYMKVYFSIEKKNLEIFDSFGLKKVKNT